jgi:DNA-binding response OmpR family regulator
VRVLVMSGYGEQHILAHLRGQGAVAILRKPFTLEILLARVAETLAG